MEQTSRSYVLPSMAEYYLGTCITIVVEVMVTIITQVAMSNARTAAG